MFLITHAASAIAAAAAIDVYRGKRGKRRLFTDNEYLVIGFCALIPDLFWPDGYGPFRVGHTVAHSLLAWLPAFFALMILSRFFYPPEEYRFKAFVFWLAYLSHVAWDCVSGGKELLYPFSDRLIGFQTLPITYWFVLDAFFLFLMIAVLRMVKRTFQGS